LPSYRGGGGGGGGGGGAAYSEIAGIFFKLTD
jgi:hypothetical protein